MLNLLMFSSFNFLLICNLQILAVRKHYYMSFLSLCLKISKCEVVVGNPNTKDLDTRDLVTFDSSIHLRKERALSHLQGKGAFCLYALEKYCLLTNILQHNSSFMPCSTLLCTKDIITESDRHFSTTKCRYVEKL